MSRRVVVSFAVICLGLGIFSTPVQAVTETESSVTPVFDSRVQAVTAPGPLNLTISPVTLSLETPPGTPVSTSIKVRNNSAVTEQLQISFGTFQADASGQKPQLLDPKPEDTYMQWLSVDQPTITVPSNEWKTITVTFAPPSDAALSYYYTILFSRLTDTSKPGETNIQGVPALLVLTTVTSPHAKKELQLESFGVKSSLLEFLPQTFTLKIKNSGNVHSIPSGNIFIDGQGQKDIAILTLNPGSNAVLPGSSREYETQWQTGFPVRNEKGQLQWDFNHMNQLRFGKYTAHALLVYDNGERDVPIESFVSFWVIPWRLIAGAIAIPVVPAILVFLIMRWVYRRPKASPPIPEVPPV